MGYTWVTAGLMSQLPSTWGGSAYVPLFPSRTLSVGLSCNCMWPQMQWPRHPGASHDRASPARCRCFTTALAIRPEHTRRYMHASHQRRCYTGRSQNRTSNLQMQRRTAAPAGRAVTLQQAPDMPRCPRVPLTDPRTRLRGNCPTLSSSSLLKGYMTATRRGVFDNV